MDSAFHIVEQRLLDIIQNQRFENNKLYSEDELVKILDASKGTVREVLRSLSRQGIVTKKHGIGNFVHPRITDMKMRIDEIHDFRQLIEAGGYQASIKKDGLPFNYSLPPQGSVYGLENYLQRETEYYCFNRIFLADERPAAYCRQFFPRNLLLRLPSDDERFGSLLYFTKTYLNQEIEAILTWISVEMADEELAGKLNVKAGTALLVWDEQFCNYLDQIIGYSKVYFVPDIMKVCLLKKPRLRSETST